MHSEWNLGHPLPSTTVGLQKLSNSLPGNMALEIQIRRREGKEGLIFVKENFKLNCGKGWGFRSKKVCCG